MDALIELNGGKSHASFAGIESLHLQRLIEKQAQVR